MRYYKAFIFFLLISSFLTACRQEEFTNIPADRDIALTINIKEMSLSFIDIQAQKSIGSWKVNKAYTGGSVLSDGDTLLLYGEKLNTIDLYSLSRGELIHQWTIGEGIVDVEELGADTIVALDERKNSVRFFNSNGEETSDIDIFDQPLEMTHDEARDELIIIGFDENVLTNIDLETMEIKENYEIHTHATGLFSLDDEIWVGGHGEGLDIEKYVHVYDRETGKALRKISVPSMPVDFTKADDAIFVVSHGTNLLYKLNEAGEVLGEMSVTANPFTIETVRDMILVAGYDSSELQFIDSETLKLKGSIEVGEGPFQILLRENEDS